MSKTIAKSSSSAAEMVRLDARLSTTVSHHPGGRMDPFDTISHEKTEKGDLKAYKMGRFSR